MTARNIFVSYSRRDRDVVKVLSSGFKVAGALVFRDEDSIEPGEQWAEALVRNIETCDRIALFWSANAAASEQVAAELTLGLHHKKSIAPLLLDKTPLPEVLQRFQYVDYSPLLTIEKAVDISKSYLAPKHKQTDQQVDRWKAYLPYLGIGLGVLVPGLMPLAVSVPIYLKLIEDKATRERLSEEALSLLR